ncbi:hypothetical protein X798_03434 [Onchocerca flexuosa]|uniref:Uncharacterized protein n=1 Tax=Onchocerca flexuosa TaxID=387005 RepID=A0A238BVW5_9BILA|nr:hypothetical protein X798_03434 [Onchocerca flexuosa]
MNLSAKVDSSIKLEADNPTTEKFSLVQRTGAEVFKCSVVLLGESVIQTEVTMKYPKMPGGVYRAVAQPDVQWKLQQIQDADNYFVQALSLLVKDLKWIRQISPNDMGKISSTVVTTITKVTNLIGQARSTLCIPEKRTLLELYSVLGAQDLTVTLADCLLPQLVDVLFLINQALNVAQQFSYNMSMLEERLLTYNHICS